MIDVGLVLTGALRCVCVFRIYFPSAQQHYTHFKLLGKQHVTKRMCCLNYNFFVSEANATFNFTPTWRNWGKYEHSYGHVLKQTTPSPTASVV
jgi:hypothetical protein